MTLSSAIKIIVKMAGIALYHRILISNAGRLQVFFKSFCLKTAKSFKLQVFSKKDLSF